MTHTKQKPQGQAKLGVRPETREKVEAVAKDKRWTLAEAVDAVFDDYLERNRIRPGRNPAA